MIEVGLTPDQTGGRVESPAAEQPEGFEVGKIEPHIDELLAKQTDRVAPSGSTVNPKISLHDETTAQPPLSDTPETSTSGLLEALTVMNNPSSIEKQLIILRGS